MQNHTKEIITDLVKQKKKKNLLEQLFLSILIFSYLKPSYFGQILAYCFHKHSQKWGHGEWWGARFLEAPPLEGTKKSPHFWRNIFLKGIHEKLNIFQQLLVILSILKKHPSETLETSIIVLKYIWNSLTPYNTPKSSLDSKHNDTVKS